jgi:hypothetical protein
MNYTELVTQIQDYVETTFDSSNVNTFIRQAENKIYNTVQLPSLRKNVTGAMSSGIKYLECPEDFLAPYSLALIRATGEYVYLLNKDVNFMRQVYPNPATTGEPKYYAIFGPDMPTYPNELTFILGPTPNASLTVELHYFYRPESIVTASTTWLGNNFDNALLYGAIREAYVFLKGEQDMVANVEAKYQEAIALLKQLGDGKDRQDAYRSGQVRYPVQ